MVHYRCIVPIKVEYSISAIQLSYSDNRNIIHASLFSVQYSLWN